MATQYAKFVDGVLQPYDEVTAEAWAGMSQFEVVSVKVVRGLQIARGQTR